MRFLSIVLAAVLLTSCQTSTPQPAVIDPAVVLTPPGSDVAPEIAAFSGTWVGTWGEKLDGKLAVQTLAADGTMTGVYAVGESPGFFSAQSYDVTGKIVGGVLSIKLNSGIYVTYQLQPDGSMTGEYRRYGQLTRGRFTKTV
jgi:hypothetical protein